MTVSVAMITVDSLDPVPLARWWAEQTGGTILAENDGWFVMVDTGPASPRLGFQKTSDPTPGKNRVHLDLMTADRVAEVERLVAAGATKVDDHDMPGFSWTILTDPDGNQFCVAQHS